MWGKLLVKVRDISEVWVEGVEEMHEVGDGEKVRVDMLGAEVSGQGKKVEEGGEDIAQGEGGARGACGQVVEAEEAGGKGVDAIGKGEEEEEEEL
ncbi:hypothetical protein Pmani_011927 [Petrolisthes manimaculis]|uniref:Uncharacterized protein n=1 Tax=Petrolisthes manimaculis TaxID=1843537 RepID=A0AAE1PZ09_9EUCA|nr:hypothetical protein Pmani_011927 [Petrolisthes manimaculis]